MPHPEVAREFAWRSGPAGLVLVSTPLEQYARHLFSTRALRYRGEHLDPDRRRVAAMLSLDAEALSSASQVHGRQVLVVERDRRVESGAQADALIATDRGRAVAVVVADCVPVLIADRRRRLVAAVHAGWRGTAAGIATATVECIRRLGVEPADLVAAIGPSAGPCCYQVDRPVRDAFRHDDRAASWFTPDDEEHWRLDLWKANRDQLIDAGVSPHGIHVAGLCSVHDSVACWSYRREGAATGRMVAAITLGA